MTTAWSVGCKPFLHIGICVHGIHSRKMWQALSTVEIVPLLLAVSRIEVLVTNCVILFFEHCFCSCRHKQQSEAQFQNVHAVYYIAKSRGVIPDVVVSGADTLAFFNEVSVTLHN